MQLEGTVQVSPAYRTLYYGLKKNHVHGAAVVHPLAFVLRRLLYALIIVFMVGEVKAFFGALMLTLTSLAMLLFVASEHQWETTMLNCQHLINETIFYIVCVSLLCFTGLLTDTAQSTNLGWLLIGIIIAMVIYNTVVILYDLLVYARLVIIRCLNKNKKRSEVKKKSSKEVKASPKISKLNQVTPVVYQEEEKVVIWKDEA